MRSSVQANQSLRFSKWNLLGFVGLFLLGMAFAIYTQQGRIQTVELLKLGGGTVSLPGEGLSWVNFWSINCPPCLVEMPYLETLHREYQGKIQIVAVSVSYDPPNEVNDYVTKQQFTLPVALDINSVAQHQFTEKLVVPSHYLVNADGKVLMTHLGELDEATMRNTIEEHM